jgi:hypothetical protein
MQQPSSKLLSHSTGQKKMPKGKQKRWQLNALETEALRLVEKGLRTGVKKFGNYNPRRDRRNMLEEAIEECRDQLVYLLFLRGALRRGAHR